VSDDHCRVSGGAIGAGHGNMQFQRYGQHRSEVRVAKVFLPGENHVNGVCNTVALDAGHVICRKRPRSGLRDKRRQSPNASDVPGVPLIVDRHIVARVYFCARRGCPVRREGNCYLPSSTC